MAALAAQQALVPTTAGFNVADAEKWSELHVNPPESPDDRKMLRACTRCRFLNVSTCTLRSLPIPHRPLNRHRGPLVVVGRNSLVRAVLASSEDESVDDPAADRSAKAGVGAREPELFMATWAHPRCVGRQAERVRSDTLQACRFTA